MEQVGGGGLKPCQPTEHEGGRILDTCKVQTRAGGTGTERRCREDAYKRATEDEFDVVPTRHIFTSFISSPIYPSRGRIETSRASTPTLPPCAFSSPTRYLLLLLRLFRRTVPVPLPYSPSDDLMPEDLPPMVDPLSWPSLTLLHIRLRLTLPVTSSSFAPSVLLHTTCEFSLQSCPN